MFSVEQYSWVSAVQRVIPKRVRSSEARNGVPELVIVVKVTSAKVTREE